MTAAVRCRCCRSASRPWPWRVVVAALHASELPVQLACIPAIWILEPDTGRHALSRRRRLTRPRTTPVPGILTSVCTPFSRIHLCVLAAPSPAMDLACRKRTLSTNHSTLSPPSGSLPVCQWLVVFCWSMQRVHPYQTSTPFPSLHSAPLAPQCGHCQGMDDVGTGAGAAALPLVASILLLVPPWHPTLSSSVDTSTYRCRH